jgi:hypothetical protein
MQAGADGRLLLVRIQYRRACRKVAVVAVVLIVGMAMGGIGGQLDLNRGERGGECVIYTGECADCTSVTQNGRALVYTSQSTEKVAAAAAVAAAMAAVAVGMYMSEMARRTWRDIGHAALDPYVRVMRCMVYARKDYMGVCAA